MTHEEENDYLWNGSGDGDEESTRLEQALAPLAPTTPRVLRRKRGFGLATLLAALTFSFVFSMVPDHQIPARIAGLFSDNFPGDIGVRGGTRVEYRVLGDNVDMGLTEQVAADLRARGANVVYLKEGTVIVDLVGIIPSRVESWGGGIASLGTFAVSRVVHDSQYMKDLAERLTTRSDMAKGGVSADTDKWVHSETGKRFADSYLSSDNPGELASFIAHAAPTPPPGTRIVYGQASWDSRRPSDAVTRTYLVETQPWLTSADLTDVRATVDRDAPPAIEMELTATGARRFQELTGNHIGHKLAIIIDGRVDSAPTVQTQITGGRIQITGPRDIDEARGFAAALAHGKLAAAVEKASATEIAPALSTTERVAARALIALPFALLVFFLTWLVGRLTPAIDPEVFPLRGSEAQPGRLKRLLVTGVAFVIGAFALQVPMPVDVPNLGMDGTMSLFELGLQPLLVAFLLIEVVASRLRRRGAGAARKLIHATWAAGLLVALGHAMMLGNWVNSVSPGDLDPFSISPVFWPMVLSLVAGTGILCAVAVLATRFGGINGFIVVLLGGAAHQTILTLREFRARDLSVSTTMFLVLGALCLVATTSLLVRRHVGDRKSSHALPLCGVIPLVLVAAAGSVAMLGGLAYDHPVDAVMAAGAALATGSGLTIGGTLVAAVVLSVLMSGTGRVKNTVRVIRPKSPSRFRSRRFWLAVGISASFVTLVAALRWGFHDMLGLAAPSALWLVFVTGAILDLVADWRANWRNPTLSHVRDVHRMAEVDLVTGALTGAGIDVHTQGLYVRRLFRFLVPFAPVRILVPADRKDEAVQAVRSLLSEPLVETATLANAS